FGGGVALRMFGRPLKEEFADVLGRVDRLVLVAPLDFAMEKPDPVLRHIAELSGVEVELGSSLNVLQERIARDLSGGAEEAPPALRGEADRLIEILEKRRRRLAAQAMIRQAIPWRENERPDWERIERLVAEYARVEVPCLIVWGERDETLPVSTGYKLAAQIPGARLRTLPLLGHTPQVQRPEQFASIVREFLASSPPPGAASLRSREGSVGARGEYRCMDASAGRD
ncbi:MAG TPA: alpha/beta hydrolase, partial [Planctomycetota bacterium]|nr:alpha/beta hydrolase [Planctomycetota bacterium]